VKIDARRATEMGGEVKLSAPVSRNKTESKIKESCWLGYGDDEAVRSRADGEDILSAAGPRGFESSEDHFES